MHIKFSDFVRLGLATFVSLVRI